MVINCKFTNTNKHIIRLTNRDRFLLRFCAKFTLTTRLVSEVSKLQKKPFSSYSSLCRRLSKLCEVGFLKRDKMLWSGEHYYYLSGNGKAWLEETEGVVVSHRACNPIKPILQQHEYEIARYLIRWIADCQKLKIPILAFWRDGELSAESKDKKMLVPDGTLILKIRGKARVFFLEMDRGTQTSGVNRAGSGVFRKKLQKYHSFLTRCNNHPSLKTYQIHRARLMVVCKSQARVEFLRVIAEEENMKGRVAFVSSSKLYEVHDSTAQGWNYASMNFLAAPLFYLPNRSPPQSLLS